MPSAEISCKPLHDLVRVRAVTVDELSDVRSVHAMAFERLACDAFRPSEIEAFVGHINSTSYLDGLVATSLKGAWVGDLLVGTSAWQPWTAAPDTARVSHIFVHPMFAGVGLGRYMASVAEADARTGGYNAFCVRVISHAVPFFSMLGYDATSHGVQHISGKISLPVTFMRKDCGRMH